MVPNDNARATRLSHTGTYMSCNHPNRAFWTGNLTENGKREYFISTVPGDLVSVSLVEKKGFHVLPGAPAKVVNGRSYLSDPLLIPCGSCVGCRMQRAKQWKIRLVHEAELYPDRCWFITMTYDDRHLPHTSDGQLCVSKRDLQLFMKRLRYHSGKKYRFFACTEYGENTKRPHAHMILFGDLDDLIPFSFNVYHSELLTKCWPYGLHEVSPAEPGTMAYVAGYVEKKQDDPDWDSYPVKPFLLMSRKPAIGSHYVQRLNGDIDNHVYGNFGNQHSSSIPRAYLKKCEDQPWFEPFKERQLAAAKKMRQTSQGIYGTTNQELIGDMKDEACYHSLEKKRNTTL